MRFAAIGTIRVSLRLLPVIACLLILPMHAAQERGRPPQWWTISSTGVTERGQFSELTNRRRVYVWSTFSDSRTIDVPSPTSQADVQHAVMQAVSAVRDLQIVANPSLAEFAIFVRTTAATSNGEHEEPGNFSLALDPSTQIGVDVAVLIPGKQMPDGTRRPRLVWDASSSNAKYEAQFAARFMVENFLSEFRKLKSPSRK